MPQSIPPRPSPPHPRADGLAKACGTERYAADLYPPGLVWAGAFRPGVAHARVRAVHTDRAQAVPGVIRVLTAKDVPGTNLQGIVHKDQPVLCEDKVRHAGDPVALVLAESREALVRVLGLITADLEPLPGVFTPEEALKPGAPLIHDGRPQGNILLRAVIAKGRAAQALRRCPVRLTGVFHLPMQDHGFLETQNGVALLTPDGVLEMDVSTQAPFRDRFEIGHALGLSPWNIRIRAPYLGGAFGGKDGATVQCLLGLAAMNVPGRPVKMVWDREECFLAGYKRHPATLRYTLGAEADGRLTALRCRLVYDTGAYAHLGGEVMELGLEHAAGPYRIEHVRLEGLAVYTNNPVAGAMRGFGVAQASFGFEGMMDALARRLDMDPLELRLKNALRPGDVNPAGVRLTSSVGLVECLETVRTHPLWTGRRQWEAQAPPLTRRGVGLAAVFNAMGYGRGLPDMAVAKLELLEDGRFRVYSSVADMGQGNASAYAQLVAQDLNQDAGAVELLQPDTERCHPSGSSSAGRTTYSFGNALLKACTAMRVKLLSRAAMVLMRDELTSLELAPGRVVHPASGRSLALADLGRLLSRDDRVCVAEFLMPVAQDPPKTGTAFPIGFPHLFFSYAAHLARVEVDELTGRIRVADYLAATDGGRVLDPQRFHQQIEGGVAQGLGYALMEEVALDQGRILSDTLSTYLLPTSLDLPDTLSLAVDGCEDTGPRGLKGVGEVGMNGPLPCLAAALASITGQRPDRAPLTPERVLRALNRKPRLRKQA